MEVSRVILIEVYQIGPGPVRKTPGSRQLNDAQVDDPGVTD
jgi:hypothetical protein